MNRFSRGQLAFDVTDSGPSDGTTVVLLHGFPQNRHVWDTVTTRLNATGFRTLAPDQRGYSPGARPIGRRAYVQSELVADVLELIDQSGQDQVHLVGHDWGAFIAWAFASRHPDRLLTLTAVSVPHPRAFAWAMPRGQLLRSWYMAAFQLPRLPEAFLTSRRGVAFLGGHALTAAEVRTYLDPLGPDGLTAILNWYRALPLSQREKGYGRRTSVPTTYVWSDRDAAIGRRAAEATQRFVDGPYQFELLTGISHWIPDQVPDQLAEIILERIE